MELHSTSADTSNNLEIQNIEVFEQILEQKRILFKRLRADVEYLGWEIEELIREQRIIAALNIRQGFEVLMRDNELK